MRSPSSLTKMWCGLFWCWLYVRDPKLVRIECPLLLIVERVFKVLALAHCMSIALSFPVVRGRGVPSPFQKKAIFCEDSKISRSTQKSSKSDIFHLLRNLLKYLPRTFCFFREVFRYFCLVRFNPLALSWNDACQSCFRSPYIHSVLAVCACCLSAVLIKHPSMLDNAGNLVRRSKP